MQHTMNAESIIQAGHTCCEHAEAARFVCAERERELLELKGPCSTKSCRLHYAHSGPCDLTRED